MKDVMLLGEGFGFEDDEGEPTKISLLELAQSSLAEGVELLRHLRVVLAVLHLDRHVENVRWLPTLASLQLCLFNRTNPESKSVWGRKICVKGCLCCLTLTLNPRHYQVHFRRVQKCCRSRKGTLRRCRRRRWLQCAGTRRRSRGRARS